jgi:hypothetical protein
MTYIFMPVIYYPHTSDPKIVSSKKIKHDTVLKLAINFEETLLCFEAMYGYRETDWF